MNNYLDEIFIKACSKGDLLAVQALISRGVDVNSKNGAALVSACSNGNLDVIKYLVENGAKIHHDGDLALHNACIFERLEAIKYLVEKGADIHAYNNWAIRFYSLKYLENKNALNILMFLVSQYNPQYIIDKLPKFIKYLDPEYSHSILADKFGVFDD